MLAPVANFAGSCWSIKSIRTEKQNFYLLIKPKPQSFHIGASGKRVVSPSAGLSSPLAEHQRSRESPPSLGVYKSQKHRWPRRNALVSMRRRDAACNRPLCSQSISCWRIAPLPLRGSVINKLIWSPRLLGADSSEVWAVPNGACENGQAVLETSCGEKSEGRTYRVQAVVHDPKSCRRIKFKSAEMTRSCLAACPLESRPSC